MCTQRKRSDGKSVVVKAALFVHIIVPRKHHSWTQLSVRWHVKKRKQQTSTVLLILLVWKIETITFSHMQFWHYIQIARGEKWVCSSHAEEGRVPVLLILEHRRKLLEVQPYSAACAHLCIWSNYSAMVSITGSWEISIIYLLSNSKIVNPMSNSKSFRHSNILLLNTWILMSVYCH